MILVRAVDYATVLAGLLDLPAFTLATLGDVVPIKSPYTPEIGLLLGDIELADFTPVGDLQITQSAVPNASVDPETGDPMLTVVPPVGGWYWETADAVNLPQLIYGYAVINAAGDTLVAVTDPLPDPITLEAAGESLNAGILTFRLPLNSIV